MSLDIEIYRSYGRVDGKQDGILRRSSIKYEEDFGYCGIDDRFFDDIRGFRIFFKSGASVG